MQTSYMGNAASTVLRLRVDPDDRSLTADSYYAANELSGTHSTNEDGAVVVTYTDKDDRTVYENRQLRNGSATRKFALQRIRLYLNYLRSKLFISTTRKTCEKIAIFHQFA